MMDLIMIRRPIEQLVTFMERQRKRGMITTTAREKMRSRTISASFLVMKILDQVQGRVLISTQIEELRRVPLETAETFTTILRTSTATEMFTTLILEIQTEKLTTTHQKAHPKVIKVVTFTINPEKLQLLAMDSLLILL